MWKKTILLNLTKGTLKLLFPDTKSKLSLKRKAEKISKSPQSKMQLVFWSKETTPTPSPKSQPSKEFLLKY